MKVMMVLLDAFRYNYISERNTPFLYDLSKKGLYISKLIPLSPFAERTELFSGILPEKSEIATKYVYNPEMSPFRWLPHMPLNGISPRYKIIRHSLGILTKYINDFYFPSVSWIPFKLLRFFDLPEDRYPIDSNNFLNVPTLFKVLKAYNMNYSYNFIPNIKNDKHGYNKTLHDIKRKYDFISLQISGPDSLGHKFGPDSVEFSKNLVNFDKIIKNLVNNFLYLHKNGTIIILGDHGMSPVKGYINLINEVESMKIQIPKDMLYFIDSTMARFWFFNDKIKEKVLRMLIGLDEGEIIYDDDRPKYGLQSKKLYGDIIYWLKPGYVFSPDFFQPVGLNDIKGMHGYRDTDERYSFAIMFNPIDFTPAKKDFGYLIDVFPTMCDVLNIEIPTSVDGKSWLR